MLRIPNMLNLFAGFRKTTTKRQPKPVAASVQIESLEQRQVLSVDSLFFSGSMLVVKTDNASTSVEVRTVGSNYQIKDVSTNRTWNYATSSVSKVEFQGGNGNDRFVNYSTTLPVRAFGGYGNDYLEGYNGNDVMLGGAGNDTLNGYGGNDQLWGGDGDDLLLGGTGNDDLMGENGQDQLNGQAGLDRLWGGYGDDVLISIDNGTTDYLQSDDGYDTLWVDQTGSTKDSMYGNSTYDKVQAVSSFTNGADRTLDRDRIADPNSRITDSQGRLHGAYVKTFSDVSLFTSSGPVASDIVQGAAGDCYFLAGLGAIAQSNSRAIRQNIVDFNDGTYGVRLGNSFYRVDNDLPVDSLNSTTPSYAKLGRSGAAQSMWVAIYEKAFAFYRSTARSYASIEGGWSVEVNRAFGTTSAGDRAFNSYSSAASLATEVFNRWYNREAVTIGFSGSNQAHSTPLVLGHMYLVTNVIRNAANVVTSIELRNPWGIDGAAVTSGNPSDGLVSVTPAQLWQFASIGRVNWGRV